MNSLIKVKVIQNMNKIIYVTNDRCSAFRHTATVIMFADFFLRRRFDQVKTGDQLYERTIARSIQCGFTFAGWCCLLYVSHVLL